MVETGATATFAWDRSSATGQAAVAVNPNSGNRYVFWQGPDGFLSTAKTQKRESYGEDFGSRPLSSLTIWIYRQELRRGAQSPYPATAMLREGRRIGAILTLVLGTITLGT